MEHGVGIIGCGLIGQKRAKALGRARLLACADIDLGRAEALARAHAAVATADWREVTSSDRVSLVIVATTNDLLAEISEAALRSGKHVLVEKPAGTAVKQLEQLIRVQEKTGGLVRVGFNHRYHPALLQAKALFDAGELGEMMYVRGRYGHGGRIGYDREWRADPKLSGGGELIDQGVHLIDLSRVFLGELSTSFGQAKTYFWDMPVDDNAFLVLSSAGGQTAFLHVSCSEWKNLFSLEIYGKNAKLHVEGLGGSYGVERLAFYKMLPEMGPPETTIWEYPRGDASWALELEEFLDDIEKKRTPSAGLGDALAAMRVVEAVYRGQNQ
jgi:predicted dehydrogenase